VPPPKDSHGINDLTRRCVVSVYGRLGPGKDNLRQAFEICRASLSKSGRIDDKGQLTNKGRQVLLKKRREMDHRRKLAAYDKIIEQNRGVEE
jgi:hypothetical protein